MMGVALFVQIPKLRGFNGGLLEDESLQCADEVERIVRRTIELSPSEVGISAELPSLARILLWTGREREAEKLLDGYVRKESNLQAALLAQFHSEAGRKEEALFVLQRALLISLLEAQSAMAVMVPMVDDSRLAELADLAVALQSDKTFASILPTLTPAIRRRTWRAQLQQMMPFGRLAPLQMRSMKHAPSCRIQSIRIFSTRLRICCGTMQMMKSSAHEARALWNYARHM